MTIAITTLIILAAILLILLVLAQDPKTGGFSSGFSPGQFMGVQKQTDLLEKITWGLAVALFVFSISTNFMVGTGDEGNINQEMVERAKETGGVQPAQQPKPAQQQQAQPAQPADQGQTQPLTPATDPTK